MPTTDSMDMISFMDFSTYNLAEEDLTGNISNIKPLSTSFYRQSLLGQGAHSMVYQAKDKESGKDYAVKQITHKSLETSIPKELFNEITILKNLNHEHVIKLIDVFRDDAPSKLLLVFEVCKYDLHEYIYRYPGDVKPNHVKCVARQLFRGLNYLHKNCIVHRDIKPGNLLVSQGGQLKICDFGLSRRFSHLDKPSTPGAMTEWYQAPEMVLGADTYDEKVDIWSAGCVIVELMTKTPFIKSESQIDHIYKMIDILGTITNDIWHEFHMCKHAIHASKRKDTIYNRLVDEMYGRKCGIILPLVSTIFVYDPKKRATAQQCVQNEWFDTAPFAAPKIDLPVNPQYMIANSLR